MQIIENLKVDEERCNDHILLYTLLHGMLIYFIELFIPNTHIQGVVTYLSHSFI